MIYSHSLSTYDFLRSRTAYEYYNDLYDLALSLGVNFSTIVDKSNDTLIDYFSPYFKNCDLLVRFFVSHNFAFVLQAIKELPVESLFLVFKHFNSYESNPTTYDNLRSSVPRQYKLNLFCLFVFLDVLRSNYGHPISVNSCYRSQRLNKQVGGVRYSRHLQALAADITCADVPSLYCFVKTFPFRFVKNGSTYIHVDI